MKTIITKKIVACLLALFVLTTLFSSFEPVFADDTDTIKGKPVTITDQVTGCTYNYVNFNGQELVHPYQGKDAWTSDGKSFLCGVNDIDEFHGTIYLYNTETNEFTRVGKGVVSVDVTGVIGSDDCVYYSTGTDLRKYDIKTKKTTIVISSDLGLYPTSLTISNDCNYISFLSNNYNNHLWQEEGEFAIFRYNIAEDKLEHYTKGFDYSNTISHYHINPANPDIVFFAHDGKIGDGEGEIPSYNYLYDREWTVNFKTGEIKNVFKQGRKEDGKCIVFTSHESWSTSGKYLYLNCYSNASKNGKGRCIIRCYPDGSYREFLRGDATGDLSADHAMATSDDKFTIVDSGKYVYLLNNDTYQQTPISFSEGRYDSVNNKWRGHPYHPHPCVARNQYKALWGLEHEGVVGVVWYDFTELAKNTSAKGGRYAVNDAIDRVSYEGIDCESEAITYADKDCYYAGNDKYLYFDINEKVVDGVNETVTITFDYFDNTTNDIKLIYTDGFVTNNDYADSEDASITIKRTGTNKWISKSITLNANFENVNPYRTDFKIGGSADTYIANLKVVGAPDPSEFYAGGDGTKQNPYQIATPEQLRFFTNHVRTTTDKTPVDSNLSYTATKVSDSSVSVTYTPARYHVFTDKYFKLTADINMGGETWTPIGNLINNFNGHFDGNGHVIKNVFINGTSPVAFERYAFFGSTGANVDIKNLGLENLTCNFMGSKTKHTVYIDGEAYKFENRLVGVAGFVSAYAGGTFENCYIKKVIVRDFTEQMGSGGTGGFFGLGYGTVKATENNGNNAMNVTNCFVNDAVIRSHSNAYGFIGLNVKPNTTGELSATDQYRVTGKLENCYSANISRGYYKDSSLGIKTTSKNYDGILYPFGISKRNITTDNCYTTSRGERTVTSQEGTTYNYSKETVSDVVLKTSDIETLKAGIVDNDNFYNDVRYINGGYPIFYDMSAPKTWDGVTDKKPLGEGTEKNPYLISTKEELVWAKNSVNYFSEEGSANGYENKSTAHFKLTADIDLEGNEWEPMGNDIVPFRGHFDGNGYTIKNFRITSYCDDYVSAYRYATDTAKKTLYRDKIYKYIGFFGKVASGALVENFGIEDARIKYYNHDYYYVLEIDENDVVTKASSLRARATGGMVGLSNGGKFVNCYVKNSEVKNLKREIHDFGIGGFAGKADNKSSFIGCYTKDIEFCASFYSSFCGFANDISSNVVITDCYSTNMTENFVFSSGSTNWDTTKYGFAKAKSGAQVTNCYSDMKDYSATAFEPEVYNANYSMGVVSTESRPVTKEIIVNGVTGIKNLILDSSLNDGYPICPWENAPFKNYNFYTTKDGVSEIGFLSGGTIDKVSFCKERAVSDCYMYTALYDKLDGNRMVACSVDFIDDSELAVKLTHTIKLSTPIKLEQADTSKYELKLIFLTDKTTLVPICKNFTYSE